MSSVFLSCILSIKINNEAIYLFSSVSKVKIYLKLKVLIWPTWDHELDSSLPDMEVLES